MSQRLLSALKKGSPTRCFLKNFTYYGLVAVTWLPAVVFFQDHVAEFRVIKGGSMYPCLNPEYNESQTRDVCLVDKRSPTEDLKRGMLVSFYSPAHPENLVVKRIVALEGDRVYTRAPYPYPIADISAGHVWVEGDNAESRKTLDSNTYGPIAVNLIKGRLTHVVWPWRNMRELRWDEGNGRTRVVKGWNGGSYGSYGE